VAVIAAILPVIMAAFRVKSARMGKGASREKDWRYNYSCGYCSIRKSKRLHLSSFQN
jgi:hypothetical protein